MTSAPARQADVWPPPPGTRIGSYELIRELGRGGMGAVYVARDIKLGRRAAMKFLHTDNPEITARFLVEARATARCSHENIVVIYEVGEHHDQPYMVLEYLQGTPLTTLLDQPLTPQRAVELIVPVIRALDCAHQQGIIHRDLKPDNIFVTDAGAVKVLDFGIAKLAQEAAADDLSHELSNYQAEATSGAPPSLLSSHEPGRALHDALTQHSPRRPAPLDGDHPPPPAAATPPAGLTQRGAIVGTIPYMSPEQWGVDEVDARSDIWAVGILLFEMVTGQHPLHPLKGWKLMVTGVLSEPMPSVRGFRPDLPDELCDVIDSCLRKHKAERIATASQLLAALQPLLANQAGSLAQRYDSPYPGLGAFQERDAGRFFGRAREINAALVRLREQPLLGVVGPSGVGKSSFVRAGLLPALKRSGSDYTSLVVRPGRQPLGALARALAPHLGPAGDHHTRLTRAGSVPGDAGDVSVEELAEHLAAEPGYLGRALRARAQRLGHSLLLVVDQLEELYTLVPDPEQRQRFTACLASAADDVSAPVRVVVTIRSDFIDRVAEDAYFMAELSRSLFFLAPPDRSSLREALVEPAEQVGYQFESLAIVQHMIDHLAESHGALPLLQFAASELWQRRDRNRRLLTEASYQAIGGITGALASHADAVIAELPPADQALARTALLSLVTPERTRAVLSLGELAELSDSAQAHADIYRLVTHLAQARLLVIQTSGADDGHGVVDATVEIVHESLIHTWPRLRRWLDDNQDDAAFLADLRAAARQWSARGHPPGLLWRGEAMRTARSWYRRYRGQLPKLQAEYLAAVFRLADRARRRRRALIVGPDGSCEPAFCGDGFIKAGPDEVCDDGNSFIFDACPSGPEGTCQPAACGDGFLRPGVEACDDNNDVTTDACPSGPDETCQPAVCGDGYRFSGVEDCDNGPLDSTNCNGLGAGNLACKTPSCGDGYVNAAAGEQCEASVDTAICNGVGAATPSGSLVECRAVACSDGYVNAAAGEECESNADCPNPESCSGSCHCEL